MSIMTIDGKDLYYEEYGSRENPCLCVLHGGPGASCIDFRRFARAVSDSLYVILFDQFGCGRSGAFEEGSTEVFGMPQHLDMIEKFREGLDIPEWVIMGHSYGGMLAALYANTHPDVISGVIYECPSWEFVSSSKNIARYYIERNYMIDGNEEAIKQAKAMIDKDYTGRVQESVMDILSLQPFVTDMQALFYIHGTTVEDFLLDYTELQLDEREMDAAAEVHLMKIAEEGTMFRDFLPLIAENKQPALLMEGCYDPACTLYQKMYFEKNAPDGQIIHFDNCGHMPHVEAKEETYAAVKEFVLNKIYNN